MAVSVERKKVSRRVLCADVSSASAEPLAATASRVDHWILVEYRGLWGRDVLGGSLLSPRLKAHLREQLAALRHARLLFVKQPGRRAHGRRALYFGSSRPGEERFFSLEVDDHEDLVSLDFATALAGGDVPGVPVEHPLFVVCTHGKRDRCCAKYGQPLYEGFRRATDPAWVWQSTHVGGDRFAGNVVCLPQGLYFGRVGEDEVGPLLDAYLDGRVYGERYRGRSAYGFAVQEAERAVREAAALDGIDDVAYVAARPGEDGAWHVRLDAGGRLYEVEVAPDLADEPAYLTCGAITPQHARRYVATGYRTLPR